MRPVATLFPICFIIACVVQPWRDGETSTDGGVCPATPELVLDLIQPRACFNTCSSNIECAGQGLPRTCPFCNFGECRSTMPASPADVLHCQRACAADVLPRPRWCDEGGCAAVLRAPAP